MLNKKNISELIFKIDPDMVEGQDVCLFDDGFMIAKYPDDFGGFAFCGNNCNLPRVYDYSENRSGITFFDECNKPIITFYKSEPESFEKFNESLVEKLREFGLYVEVQDIKYGDNPIAMVLIEDEFVKIEQLNRGKLFKLSTNGITVIFNKWNLSKDKLTLSYNKERRCVLNRREEIEL